MLYPLSYRRMSLSQLERVKGIEPSLLAWKASALPLSYTRFCPRLWSGREDLNLRPPAPKAGALAKLRYAPQTAVPFGLTNDMISHRLFRVNMRLLPYPQIFGANLP